MGNNNSKMKLDIQKALETLKPFCIDTKLPEPWSFSTEALENTLNYITALSYNCYVYADQFYKIEFQKTAPLLKHHLTQKVSQKIKKTLRNKQWRIMQCIIKPFGKSEDFIFGKFLEKVNIPKGIYIFSLTDSQLLRKDFRTPWFKDSTNFKPPFIPMYAYSGHQEFYDIPIPNIDEIEFIKNPPEIPQYEWTTKQSKAVFRGSSTGCGTSAETNQRIKISQIQHPYLDAGLTSLTKQLKSDPLTGISQTPNLHLVPKLDMFKEQALYRIIIHIDGNVLAYRLLPSFLTGSLIFRVQSPYIHWLDTKFKAGKHFIAIKEDLSDLTDKIIEYKDLKKGEKIALEGKKFAKKYLTEKSLIKYLESKLNF
jgi:hypothetical protein